jgi:hypothetical protein
MVFKYLLMYVFVTGVETGGQIWRLLFNRLLVSCVLFQVVMIGVLNLKSARTSSLAVLPLPFITILFKLVCSRRFDSRVYYYTPTMEGLASSHPSDPKNVSGRAAKNSIGFRFGDPAFFAELPVPMVHERVRHLLPKLYGNSNKTTRKPFVSRMTRQKSIRHVSVIHLQNNLGSGGELKFQSIGEKDLELDDSTEGVNGLYKFNEDEESENVVDPPKTSYYSNSFSSQNQINGNSAATNPLKRLSNRISASFHNVTNSHHSQNDMYSPRRPLVTSASYMDTNAATEDAPSYYNGSSSVSQQHMNQDMEYFVAGRAYKSHDPHHLDSSNVIEMANIYRSQQQPYQSQHQEHTNVLMNGYNHYIRSPVSAYTSGNGRTTNHQQQMMSNQQQQQGYN